MNIALIGYRGTGKTVVSQLLGERMERRVVIFDHEVEHLAHLSIPEIVEKHGWGYFRQIESQVTELYSRQNNLILDTGGGVVTRDDNIANLQKNSIVIWLTAPPEVIIHRIRQSTNRPSLTGSKNFIEEIHEMLEQRNPLYKKAAHHTVDTTEKSSIEVVDKICLYLEMHDDL